MTVKHGAARGGPLPRIPNADGAGVVTAVGAGVAGIAVGDRVVSCFFQDWTDGACSPEAMASALGGAVDGVLAEEGVRQAAGVVPVPAHLSTAEAATLPCPALTPGHALVEVGPLQAAHTLILPRPPHTRPVGT